MKRVLDFLTDLGSNNNREWFTANKNRYKEAETVFNAFAGQLIGAIGEWDEAVRGLTVRDCTYRIYRDTRFSHDKTPYKTHMGVYVCPGGKKSGNGGYYFHVEPAIGGEAVSGEGESGGMIGSHALDAGIYMPELSVLKSVRDEIFDNGEEVLAAISRARQAAGFELDRSNSLKRTPKGWPIDSEWDEYLKLKDLHLSKMVDDAYVLAPDLARRAAKDFRSTHDFMTLMYRAARFAREEQA
ncbi:MAG: DUF2461 domain-containing protein [Alistipes sp.]|jgi:uncharacterized protein (TIGR02453 family)|nr:DUF2461 domain-containing protein [Alistipes sp.]